MEMTRKNPYPANFSQMMKNSDILMAVAVVGILVFMVIPLPSFLLDLLLSFNITFAIIILLVGMYILKPLDFSAFPSVLLLTTLFRLSLNIASTRLILLHGNEGNIAAGKVISAFGSFVVGGNYLVGMIVFLILVVINFMVITKGAGRIAEVAARFTLDAMPGKQMSIDADLNAGLINDEEAKERRKEIAQEAEYYGAMDGANKFVRGDAIAGIIITMINIVGGFCIGVFQNGMSFSDAAQNYTLLTIGDGLVSQIPALIISTAAGIIVSRAGSEQNMGNEVASQILLKPRPVAIAAAVLLGFALVPGLPTFPFMTLAAAAGLIAYTVHKAQEIRKNESLSQEAAGEKERSRETADRLPVLDALSLEVGYGLIPLVDAAQGGELLDRIKSVRRQIAREIGIVVPPIHIQDNINLKPGEYAILLKGNEIARGELMVNYLLAMNPGDPKKKIEGVPTHEPTYNLPAYWIREGVREKAMTAGFTVVDLSTVLTTHLSELIRRHAHELLGRQEVQQLLDGVKESHPKVVEELIPSLLTLGAVGKVLQNLLMEQIPVRDLLTILETLADWSPITKDVDILTEYVRQSLARTITRIYQTPEGSIPVVTIDQRIEKAIADAVQRTDQSSFLAIEPSMAQKIMKNLGRQLEKFTTANCQPIVLCSAQIRAYFKQLADRFIPDLVVLSYNDILSNVQIQSLGTVRLSDAD